MKISVLYEDKNILVINKPAGISVHPVVEQAHYGAGPDDKNKEKTIADWFVKKYPKSKNVGESTEGVLRPGIVHRLDKETSGVLLLAKNQKTFLFLKNQFQNHKIEKIYHTFVYGSVNDPKASLLNKKRGVINAPIGRSPNDIRMWTAGRGARQPVREAITEYKVLNRFHLGGKVAKDFSFLEVYPKTGRTHQIRVHLRYINYPVVSDSLYASGKKKALGFKRTALHAYSVSFLLPDGIKKTIIAPYPEDFQKVVKKYVK